MVEMYKMSIFIVAGFEKQWHIESHLVTNSPEQIIFILIKNINNKNCIGKYYLKLHNN